MLPRKLSEAGGKVLAVLMVDGMWGQTAVSIVLISLFLSLSVCLSVCLSLPLQLPISYLIPDKSACMLILLLLLTLHLPHLVACKCSGMGSGWMSVVLDSLRMTATEPANSWGSRGWTSRESGTLAYLRDSTHTQVHTHTYTHTHHPSHDIVRLLGNAQRLLSVQEPSCCHTGCYQMLCEMLSPSLLYRCGQFFSRIALVWWSRFEPLWSVPVVQ